MPRDLFADLPDAGAPPTPEQLRSFAFEEAQRQGVDPGHVLPMFKQESGFRADARSPVGAFGPAQLMPGTARDLGVNPADPYDNIRGGITYYKQQLERFKDPTLARAAYNAGPGAVQKHGGIPPFAETQDYVEKTRPLRDLLADLPAQAGPATPAPPTEKVSFEAPFRQQLRRGITETYGEIGRLGMRAGEALGLVDPKTARDYERQKVEEQLLYEAHNPGFQAGRLLGNVAAIPISPATGTLAKTALMGGLNALTMPTTATGDDYWSSKAVQAGTGAVAAPVVQALGRGAAKVTGKLAGAVRGRMEPEAAQLLGLQQKFDVPLTYGDITGNQFARRAESALEYTPILGTAGSRAVQEQKATQAAVKVGDALFNDMINTPFHGIKQIEQAAAAGKKPAQDLLRAIAESGDDWNRIIQASGNVNLFRKKLISDKLYNEVGTRAAGKGWVDLSGTQVALMDAYDTVAKDIKTDPALLRMLAQFKDRMDDPAVDISFEGVRRFRSDLADEIRAFYSGRDAVTGSKGVEVFQRVKNAVDADMEKFIQDSGDSALRSAWKRADSFYKKNVIPYKNSALAKTLTDAPPDKIFGMYLESGSRDVASKFYKALDPRGQAAVRYGFVTRAAERAADPKTQLIDPGKYASVLERLAKTREVAFEGAGRHEIDGFAKLMRHAEAAGNKRLFTPLPQQLIGVAGAAAAGAVHMPLTLAGGGVAAFARLMLTTEAGKRYLLAANMLKPGSSAMADLAEKVNQLWGRSAAVAAGGAQGAP